MGDIPLILKTFPSSSSGTKKGYKSVSRDSCFMCIGISEKNEVRSGSVWFSLVTKEK